MEVPLRQRPSWFDARSYFEPGIYQLLANQLDLPILN